jgi:hypothetical protein
VRVGRPTIEPYFNETGSNCPSELTLRQQRELCELCVAASKVLGFQVGVLHVEAKYTSHGPQLIEVCSPGITIGRSQPPGQYHYVRSCTCACL